VGADTGQFASGLRQAGFTGKIVSFEHGSEAHRALSDAAALQPSWQVESRCAIGAFEGPATLRTAHGRLSLDPTQTGRLTAGPNGGEVLSVVTLAGFLERTYGGRAPSFALKISAPGLELDVLDGLGAAIDQCQMLIIQTALSDCNRASALPALIDRLQSTGFRCVELVSGGKSPLSRDSTAIACLFLRPAVQPDDDDFYLFTSIPPTIKRLAADGVTDIGSAYQRECVHSWKAAGFKVVSINPQSEEDEISRLGLDIDFIFSDKPGIPTIDNIMFEIKKRRPRYCGIINADCKIIDYPEVALALRSELDGACTISERVDVDAEGRPSRVPGFDLFLFNGESISNIDHCPFRIGDTWWDYWFPTALAAKGYTIRNLSIPLLTHLTHDRNWDVDRWRHNAQVFWLHLKQWRINCPDRLSSFDSVVGENWDAQEVSNELASKLADHCFEWLSAGMWKPHVSFSFPHSEPERLLEQYRYNLSYSVTDRLRLERDILRAELGERTAELDQLRRSVPSKDIVEIDRLRKELSDQVRLIEQLSAQINEIKSSVAWHVSKPIRLLAGIRRRSSI
jgi:hypothetical protein